MLREPTENFRNHTFTILGKRPFEIERALQKGKFCSFAVKSRDLDPQGPLVVRLKSALSFYNLFYHSQLFITVPSVIVLLIS